MAAKVIKLSSVMGEDRRGIPPRRTSHESRWDILVGNAQDRRGSRTKQRLPIKEEQGRKRVSSLPLEKPSYKARVAVLSEGGEDPDAFCFCTGPQKGVKAEEWVVDSGATNAFDMGQRSVCHICGHGRHAQCSAR